MANVSPCDPTIRIRRKLQPDWTRSLDDFRSGINPAFWASDRPPVHLVHHTQTACLLALLLHYVVLSFNGNAKYCNPLA